MTDIDTLVIGGGQAGLAAAHALRHAGRAPVVLEAGEEPVGSWPSYYDSLTLSSCSTRVGCSLGRRPAREQAIVDGPVAEHVEVIGVPGLGEHVGGVAADQHGLSGREQVMVIERERVRVPRRKPPLPVTRRPFSVCSMRRTVVSVCTSTS